MIPETIRIQDGGLPDSPGVYRYYDVNGVLLYIGKATSLKKRVSSYFNKAQNTRLTELVSKIADIKYQQTPTVLEALVLEASLIHAHQPPYNILAKDDKSFLYLCITNEDFPRPLLMRGLDLERMGIQPFSKTLSPKARRLFKVVYGPYTSGKSLKIALELLRKAIPWSTCLPDQPRPCFDAQIGRCPGVCTGAIGKRAYGVIMRRLMRIFEGQLPVVARELERAMRKAAKDGNYETAATLRDQYYALTHIQDVALITRDEPLLPLATVPRHADYIDVFGRIEAYDIANISGTANVASMVVFVGGQPLKQAYRKFRIKTVVGADDFASMEEVLRRRLHRAEREPNAWPLPELFVIDGGEGQVNRVKQVLKEMAIELPVIGIAKGFDRKQDRLVFDESNTELLRIATSHKDVLQLARDEAHRFAGAYHRVVRGRLSGIPRRRSSS